MPFCSQTLGSPKPEPVLLEHLQCEQASSEQDVRGRAAGREKGTRGRTGGGVALETGRVSSGPRLRAELGWTPRPHRRHHRTVSSQPAPQLCLQWTHHFYKTERRLKSFYFWRSCHYIKGRRGTRDGTPQTGFKQVSCIARPCIAGDLGSLGLLRFP